MILSEYLPLMSKRTRQVLQILTSEQRPLTAARLAQLVKTSKRLVYYDLKAIDGLLKSLGTGSVLLRDQGYMLTEEQKKQAAAFLQRKLVITEKVDRTYSIICSVTYPRRIIRIETLAETFEVSRNTVLHDLADVHRVLEGYQLTLCNTRRQGYYIEGETFRKRSVLLYSLGRLLKDVSRASLDAFDAQEVETYHGRLCEIFRELGISNGADDLMALAYMLSILRPVREVCDCGELDLENIRGSSEWKLAESRFPEFDEQGLLFLAVHLLGVDGSQSSFLLRGSGEFLRLSEELVDLFEATACLRFEKNGTGGFDLCAYPAFLRLVEMFRTAH